MELTDLASKLTAVEWQGATFAFDCPNHPGSKGRALIVDGKVRAACPKGCMPDQIVAAAFRSNGHAPAVIERPALIAPADEVINAWRRRMRTLAENVLKTDPEFHKPHLTVDLAIEPLLANFAGIIRHSHLPDWQPPSGLTPMEAQELIEGAARAALEGFLANRALQLPPAPSEGQDEPLRAYSLQELYAHHDEWERQPWVWEGILPSSSLSLIVGKSETGKSTIICGLIHAIAKGLTFFGRSCQKGRVLYLAADPGSEFVAARTFRRLGLDPQDEVRTVIGALVGRKDGWEQFRRIVAELRPLLIIADTLGATVSIDTDKYSQSYQSQQPLNQIARQFKLNVLAAHHSQKAAMDSYSVIDAALGSVGVAAAASTRMGTKMYRRKGEKFYTFEMSSLRIGQPIEGEWVVRLNDNGLMELDRLWSAKNAEMDAEQITMLLERKREPMAKRSLWQDLSPKPKWGAFNLALEKLTDEKLIVLEKRSGKGGGWQYRLATAEERELTVNRQSDFDP
jgi:hypothetical protein